MIVTADKAQIGLFYQVKNITIKGEVSRHLQRLGITKGNRLSIMKRDLKSGIVVIQQMRVAKNVEISVRKLAPLGNPIEVNLRGYELTLRKDEAALILIERIE